MTGDNPTVEASAPSGGWLTAEEQATWTAAAAMVVQLPGVLDAQLQRDSGITLFDYFVLSGLSMAEDHRLRIGQLAAITNGSLTRLSNIVIRLERRGLVVRHPDPDDGRATVARLTPAGVDLIVAAAPNHVDTVRQFVLEPLSVAQQRSLTAIAERIHQRIAAAKDDAPH